MGFADTVTKNYMNENTIFADAFNMKQARILSPLQVVR